MSLERPGWLVRKPMLATITSFATVPAGRLMVSDMFAGRSAMLIMALAVFAEVVTVVAA